MLVLKLSVTASPQKRTIFINPEYSLMFPPPISFLQVTKKVMFAENFPPSPSCVVIHSGMPRSSVGDTEVRAKEAIASHCITDSNGDRGVGGC